MCLCFETIKIANSKPLYMEYHNKRANKTRRELFGAKDEIDLEDFICCKGDKRCKIIYDKKVQNVEYHAIKQRVFRTFMLKECNFSYRYKYLKREALQNDSECDDVIFYKNGLLCDTSIANIALFCDGKWCTPVDPLLQGATRQRLIDEGFLHEKRLYVQDLIDAKRVAICNAIVGFLEIDDIKLKL